MKGFDYLTMDKKEKKPNQNNSMFLYTALIFLVALVLIILAFFGKINRPENATAPELPEDMQTTSTYDINNMKEDINILNSQLSIYESLVKANSYIADMNYEEADALISNIDENSLTEEQKVLYDQIINIINNGMED